jgi:hypothetical protein
MKIPTKDQVPKPGYYYHYKHDLAKGIRDYAYEVCAVGFHTEDDCRPGDTWFVNYRPLYEDAFVYQAGKRLSIECMDNRPLEMWMGKVTKDGRTFPRFSRISDPAVIAELEVVRKEMYGK